ncbi:hypothetical protein BDV96DRAFT_580464 [Lophiotrema nucula]|uniref:Uncharacterized protein n=1 Tax=Lophiotrema nucula TaxID=690887 RepID=A0A6A5Z1L0_9PLEO|nr:hypothetical protein BDV96DRAFT_580464 [Lophiotrema nucula]
MESPPTTSAKGKARAADVKHASKPVVFSGFKRAPDLVNFVDNLRDGALYDIKVEHTVSVVFKDPAVAEQLITYYGDTGVPFEGQQLSIKYPDGAQHVVVPDSIVTPLFNYGATRVLRLSSRKDTPGLHDLTPVDVHTLSNAESDILKMYKPVLPENTPLRVFVVEFSSVSGCVAAVNKVTQGKAGAKFAKWNATYGPDPCAADQAAPVPSSTSAGPLKDSAPAVFKGEGVETKAGLALDDTKPPVVDQLAADVGDLMDFSSSGSEPDKMDTGGGTTLDDTGKDKAVEKLTEAVASLDVAAEKKGGLAGSKWAS